MPRINLLPWREKARRERQRQFVMMAGGMAVLSVLGVLLLHIRMTERIAEQNGRNTFMEGIIVEVDKEIDEIKTLKADKEALLARMNVIQKLQTSRPEIVHIFHEFTLATPDDAYLVKFTRGETDIQLEGVADSNAGVSAFMRNLEASDWLADPKLIIIDSSKREYSGASWFNLTVTQTPPQTKEAAK